MSKSLICRNCGKDFPKYKLIDDKWRNLKSRKNCLECSPFGAGRVIPPVYPYKDKNKVCESCGKPHVGRRTICNSCYTKVRRHRTKTAAVELLGGKCSNCGWKGNVAAFDFHHIRGKKDFTIASVANRSWAIIKKELEKCILLCANCHRIEHSNRTGEAFLKIVEKYAGMELT